jgi:hypothetical protein
MVGYWTIGEEQGKRQSAKVKRQSAKARRQVESREFAARLSAAGKGKE